MRRLAGLVGALGLLLAGCAAIPTSGPVNEVADDDGFGQSTVRYSPALPVDGAAPSEIVRGFLDAMLAYPASSRTAAEFLTPEAAATWKRQDGVTVYRRGGAEVASAPQDGRARAESGAGAGATVTYAETGRLDEQGRYSVGRGSRDVRYQLEKVDGQWRIADPQPGLLVTDKFFADYFRPFDLFYFDRPAQRLTSQPVHLLVDDRLAAALITSLARGSGSDQLRTFVPPVDDLRATVPVSDGSADVGFTRGGGDPGDVERLSAQVIWTLRQVPGITDVRITAGSQTLSPRGNAEQPITSWDEYGISMEAGRVFALRKDRVVQIDGSDVTPIDGRWGDDAEGAAAAAVTDQRVALLAAGRRTVRIAPRDGAVQRTVSGNDLLDPVSDVDGQFWVVDRSAGATRVRVVGQGVTTLQAQGIAGLDVSSLQVSPDGSQYVVTSGSSSTGAVSVGRIVRNADGDVTGLARPRRLDLGGLVPRSAVWSDGVRVSFLAASTAGIQVQTALIDGSLVSGGSTGGRALLPDVDAGRLVVGSGPDPASYATDPKGRLWYLGAGGSWRLVDTDTITSLSYTR